MSVHGNLAFAATAPAAAQPGVAAAPITHRTGLGMPEFRREHLVPRRPVVFSDLAREWPLYHRSAPQYLRRRFGAQPLRVCGRRCTLAELLEQLERTCATHAAPAACRIDIARELGALLPEITPRFAHSLPDRQRCVLIPAPASAPLDRLELVLGAPGSRFPHLQCDALARHSWITLLHGEREFTLIEPSEQPFVYPDPDLPWQSAMRNPHAPDALRYPLYRNVQPQRVLLQSGETLFLPSGRWYRARSAGLTIAVAFQQLGADNWPDFVDCVTRQRPREGNPGATRVLHTYLNGLGAALAAAERLHANRNEQWGSV